MTRRPRATVVGQCVIKARTSGMALSGALSWIQLTDHLQPADSSTGRRYLNLSGDAFLQKFNV